MRLGLMVLIASGVPLTSRFRRNNRDGEDKILWLVEDKLARGYSLSAESTNE